MGNLFTHLFSPALRRETSTASLPIWKAMRLFNQFPSIPLEMWEDDIVPAQNCQISHADCQGSQAIPIASTNKLLLLFCHFDEPSTLSFRF